MKMEYLHTIICRALAMTEVNGRCLLVDSEVRKSNKFNYILVSVPKSFGKKVVVSFCELVCKFVNATYILAYNQTWDDQMKDGDSFVMQFKLGGK